MSSREVLRVRLDDLQPDAGQVRTEFANEALQGLAKSLEGGQLHPILAYRRDGRLIILDGERRWRAAKLAKLPTLDTLVIDDPIERGAVLQRQLVANLQREDLNPLERGRAIKRLLSETGWTAARVAVSLGISPASASRAVALLELPADIQAQVGKGELPASTAYEIARSGDHGRQSELANKVAEEGLTRDRVSAIRSRSEEAKPKSTKGAARVTAVLGGGRSITLSGAELATLDGLIECVEELLQRAKKARPRGVELQTFLALLRDEAKAKSRAIPAGEDTE